MAQQAADGGWHSVTYGSMKPGASITAHVLYAMSHVPADLRKPYRKQLERGLAFLRIGIGRKGFVTPPDGTLDYPTYATALTLSAVRKLGLRLPKKEHKQLVAYLVREQLTEKKGFKPGHPDYGGWDLLGGSGTVGVTSGSNISLAAYVLEALQPEKSAAVVKARKRAVAWLSGCQNFPQDGGFFFHPQNEHLGNKALWADNAGKSPRSYGTATCDGIACLRIIGGKTKKQSKRLQTALTWLASHGDVKFVPGFEKAPKTLGWKEGLRFYYYGRLATVLPLLSQSEATARRKKLREILVKDQKSDGRWQNDSARMREDDPLIATCFAIVALAELEYRDSAQTN